MTDQSIEVQIDAPAATVWAILADAASWPQWTASVTSAELLDDAPLGVGSRVRIRQPRLPTTVWTVTRLDEGRAFTWESRGPGVHSVAAHEVEPIGAERSVLRLRVTQSGVIGAPVGRLYRRLTDRYLAMESNGLRARAETEARRGGPSDATHPPRPE